MIVAVIAEAAALVISINSRLVLENSLPLPASTPVAADSSTPEAAVVITLKAVRAIVDQLPFNRFPGREPVAESPGCPAVARRPQTCDCRPRCGRSSGHPSRLERRKTTREWSGCRLHFPVRPA